MKQNKLMTIDDDIRLKDVWEEYESWKLDFIYTIYKCIHTLTHSSYI